MSWGWYPPPSPKRPPPRHGIKLKKVGTTWWGKHWIEALERMSAEYSNRLPRGRTYARQGRAHDLMVKPGEVTARVTGSRAKPYRVRIVLATLSDAAWRKAIDAMASQVRFSAELLAGRMPQDIDAAFEQAGARLFPTKPGDLKTDCSCPDWANPCKHVAATHFVLGEALDRDPFLLFELRGRSREQVLDALRNARSGEATEAEIEGAPANKRSGRRAGKSNRTRRADRNTEPATPCVSLSAVTVADYERPPQPLPSLHLSFEPPPAPGAIIRQLGVPAGWSAAQSPTELLAPLLRAAAEYARGIALSEPVTNNAAPDAGSRVESRRNNR